MILKDSGVVKLQLAGNKKTTVIYNGKAKIIKPENISATLLDLYETKQVLKLYNSNELNK